MSQTKTVPLPESQRRKVSWRGLGPLVIGGIVLLFIAWFLSRNPHIHPVLLFGDLTDFIDPQFQQPYIGLFSQVGMIFWFSGASFCGLAAFLSWKMGRLPKRWVYYLAVVAFGTAYLGLDDLLLFHERLLPVYLGINEKLIIVIYGVLFLASVVYFWREIRAHQFIYFLIYAAITVFSMSVDMFRTDNQQVISLMLPSATLLEEGSKFLSLIALWMYCLFLSYEALMDSFKSVKKRG